MDPGMADPGFPDAHTTTTTTTTRVQTNIRFDPTYVRSIPGILKCVTMVINLIGYISIMFGPDHSTANWFSFVSMMGFWITGILMVLYLMHILERFHMVPWFMLEFGYCALWAFFYFTAATASAVKGGDDAAFAAAAFFGYVALILYSVDAFFKFKDWRSGNIAQGERQVQMGGDLQSPGAY
ncbi:CKLF-like MARVEL transmembrane domain-containing protein 4 [Macrobrachium nipponense]|uniref:CKLF-like MARVEL transmembrane domain-containing protein 4 n=1 Tax=Macrobrachium nipponense TaxID=159736 RepID=UPI0030C83B20